MKLLTLFITTLLIVSINSTMLEAKKPGCGKNRHFATRTKCKKGKCKTTSRCYWNKGYPKKSTAQPVLNINNHNSFVINQLESAMPINFYDTNKKAVASGLSSSLLQGNPNDGSECKNSDRCYYVNVPNNAASMKVGPNENDTNDDRIVTLDKLKSNKLYYATIDNDGNLIAETA